MASGGPKGNRLLPILAVAVVVMAVIVGYRALTSRGGVVSGVVDALRKAPEPDADTPAETIRTLTAQVASMNREVEALRETNDALLRSSDSNRETLRRELAEELKAEQKRLRQDRQDDTLLKRLQGLSERIDNVTGRVMALDASEVVPDLDTLTVGGGVHDENAVDWLDPIDSDGRTVAGTVAGTVVGNAGGTNSFQRVSSLLRPGGPSAARPVAYTQENTSATVESAHRTDEPRPLPVYTLPKGTGLVGATAWTALIGRIPVDGRIEDPYPYKVLLSAENLAANGHRIPGVAGAVAGGTASGDFNLSCVKGDIAYITFIFDDGTIRTVDAEDTGSDSLGYLSDNIGAPCVSGTYKGNAAAYLTNRILVGAAETGAYAAAASETTSTVNPEFGTGTTTVTGDKGRYVAGKILAGGVHEARDWLDARMGSSFDAIFKPAGAVVALNLEQAVEIDYEPAPIGRKIDHAFDPYSAFQNIYRSSLD